MLAKPAAFPRENSRSCPWCRLPRLKDRTPPTGVCPACMIRWTNQQTRKLLPARGLCRRSSRGLRLCGKVLLWGFKIALILACSAVLVLMLMDFGTRR